MYNGLMLSVTVAILLVIGLMVYPYIKREHKLVVWCNKHNGFIVRVSGATHCVDKNVVLKRP